MQRDALVLCGERLGSLREQVAETLDKAPRTLSRSMIPRVT